VKEIALSDFNADFIDYVLSGHAMLSVLTHEKERAIDHMLRAANKAGRKLFMWSIGHGWTDHEGTAVCGDDGLPEPDKAIAQIQKLPKESICVLKDFNPYLRVETWPRFDVVLGLLQDSKAILANTGRTIVFVGPDLQAPLPLRHDITQIEFGLPDEEDIQKQIMYVCEGVQTQDGKKFKPNMSLMPQIVQACKGMTQQEVIDRVALALRKHKDLNENAAKTLLHEKAGVIRASGILTYIEPPAGGLSMVGGLAALKQHVRLDLPTFSQAALDFGCEFPKGLLLVGTPGGGKTMISLAIASEFGFPMIGMDVGNLMDKYVGESEANMRAAIQILESVAPCVLQLDEVEKGFGGVGDLDGGASKRVFGTFIKWLNDHKSPVYVVATANQVESLPPEFGRKGRFDEIFGVDLPSDEERAEIVRIHLSKRKRDPKNFGIDELVQATENFTGADIEQAIKVALKMAFVKKSELTTEFCLAGAKSITPLSKTEPQRIQAIRDWCATHATPANIKPVVVPPHKGGRRVQIDSIHN
jgi:ATP-dependent 26S proteasome regulatory subunit